jgi:hypothetical protein
MQITMLSAAKHEAFATARLTMLRRLWSTYTDGRRSLSLCNIALHTSLDYL